MSSDSGTAFGQGQGSASAAKNEAVRLGFTGGGEIYYDMEAFDVAGHPASQTCKDAVRAFMDGYTSRLQSLGWRAGYYGSSSGSNVQYLAGGSPPPDDIWFAESGTGTSSTIVNPGNWVNSQRIKQESQYNNTNQTYGGVTLLTDRDCAGGHINVSANAQVGC